MANRWLILGALFAARLGMGFQFQTLGSTAGQITTDLGLSNTELGTLIGLFMLPGVFLAFPSGWLARWASDRTIAAGGMLLLAAGGALGAVSAEFFGISIGRVICGAGFVLATMYFTKMTVDWFAGRELATAMGILVVSWPGGIALSQVVHSSIALSHDWQTAVWSASVYCMFAAMLVVLTYRRPPDVAGTGATVTVISSLTPREWWLTSLAGLSWGFFNAGYLVFLSFAVPVLISTGMSAVEAAFVVSLASWLAMISLPGAGAVADRFKIPETIMYCGMATAVIGILGLPIEGLGLIVCVVLGLIGFAPGGLAVALTGAAMAPERRAFGMGIFQTIFFLVTAAAPLAGGLLLDATGSLYGPLGLAAALMASTGITYWVFQQARKHA